MVIPVPQEKLKADFAFWSERVRIARERYAAARNDEQREAAAGDIQDAKNQVASLRRLLAPTDRPSVSAGVVSASPSVRMRIRHVLYPTLAMSRPDSKRDKSSRDKALRKRMRGIQRSDDSRGHGRRKQK